MNPDNIIVVREVEVHVVGLGEQGPPGPPGTGSGSIDDAVVALDSTFSSQHITELISPFSITSFTLSQTTAEMGATVASEHLAWTSNYTPDAILINNGIGTVTPASTTSYDHTGQTITTNRTYTITLTKSGVPKTANATISFLNQYYWGVNAAQVTDETSIKAMSKALSGSRARSPNFNCTGGRYFHIAYPTRLGDASFSINGLSFSDMTKAVVSITNASGFAENYNVYYSNMLQNGASITLVVT